MLTGKIDTFVNAPKVVRKVRRQKEGEIKEVAGRQARENTFSAFTLTNGHCCCKAINITAWSMCNKHTLLLY
jgi:hypothetical protein